MPEEIQKTPTDYLERVYAGVLGKLIGVYLGRPFENWTHERILSELGPINDYVHDKLGVPLVVTDDDVSGTFAFVRALEEHAPDAESLGGCAITSEQIGKTWLNNVIENRTVFWWGGKGISTEHTAYLNLKHGIPAPASGSANTNGLTVAEQIGAQIFIDAWALVAPKQPALAAQLAQAAGRVSHDGESVYAAMLWAAMEAEAFASKDVDHLLDVGISYVPADCLVARMVKDVREWCREDNEWMKTRQRIEDVYGYDKFLGWCHVIPNHAIMIMALIYGGSCFSTAMMIVNTAGRDTDCNSGNVGCLVALMHGMSSFEGGRDWRGPLADRALISTADGGYSINNAARIAIDVANAGCRLSGEAPLPSPKNGAQFHFTLPGSVQGFQVVSPSTASVTLKQDVDDLNEPGLAIDIANLGEDSVPIEVLTPTSTPKDILKMGTNYSLMASPLVYPGQKVVAELGTSKQASTALQVRIRIKVNTAEDGQGTIDSEAIWLTPGTLRQSLEWTIPDSMESQPIEAIGIAISATGEAAASTGTVWLKSLGWTGAPQMTLMRPKKSPSSFWDRSWVNGVDTWLEAMGVSVCIAQSKGEGIVSYGTREWTDYSLAVSRLVIKIGGPSGIAIRVQGLNRYYALVFNNDRYTISLIKAKDEKRIELARVNYEWRLDEEYEVTLEAKGDMIRARVRTAEIVASDSEYLGGALGLVVTDGSLSVDSIKIAPVE